MTRLHPDQFARVVKQHHEAVYRSALRVVSDSAMAADVAQDVFVRALRGKVRFDRARDEAATLCWLAARLAQNALRAQRRRRRHEENAMSRSPESSSDDPAAAFAARDLQDAVQHGVAQLPDDLRVPMQLHCQESWTLAAVGSALQLSTSTVHDRVQRGFEQLRAWLESRGFALTAVALPDLVRDVPPPVVPGGLEAQLLAAGKASVVVGVEATRRIAVTAALAVAAVGGVIATDAFGGGDTGAPPVEAVGAVLASASEQDPQPRPNPTPIERARVLPGDADGDAYREALARLPSLAPPRFVKFHGTVHDSAAWPVTGARVEVVAAGGLKAFGLGEGRTDHVGRFSFEVDVGSLGPSAVRVKVVEDTAPVLVTDEIRLPRADPKAPLTLVLPASAGVATDRYEWRVFAHDESGAAVPGVSIATFPAPLQEPGKVAGFADARGRTDESGEFELRGRRLGEKWLFVDGREVGRGYTFEKVVFDRGGARELRVLVPAGDGLTVRVASVDDESLDWKRIWLRDERLGVYVNPPAAAWNRGEVTFTGLGDGPYTVHAAAGACSQSAIRGVVARGQTIDIALKRLSDERDVGDHMAEVHGAVFDADTGEELELHAFHVEFLRARAGESSLAYDRLVPPAPVQRAAGNDMVKGFHEGGLEPGRHAVVVTVPGYVAAVHEFEVGEKDLVTGVRIEVSPGATVRGRLVDTAGRPVARRLIRTIGVGAFADECLEAWRSHRRGGRGWRRPPTWACCSARTDADGLLELRVPDGVPIRLFAQCLGGGVGVLDVGAIPRGVARENVALRVSR